MDNQSVMTYKQFKTSKNSGHSNWISQSMSNDGDQDQYILNDHPIQYMEYLHDILNNPDRSHEDKVQSNLFLIEIGSRSLKYDH